MPRVWFLNIEHVVDPVSAQKAMHGHVGRYLLLMEKGDYIITPVKLDPDFLEYARKMRGLPPAEEFLIELKKVSEPYSLAESVFLNPDAVEKLRRAGAQGCRLEPFIQNKEAADTAARLGMPFSGSKYGVLAGGLGGKLNDKIYFKDVARELDIPVIEYCTANDASGVKAAIHKVSAENKDRVILKKPCNAGGYGNLAGTEAELLARLPQWYDGGDLIIEHHKTLLETAGSLALLEDDRTDFIGADLQFVENNAWRGCVFPNSSKAYAAQVQKHTMAFSEYLRAKGVRGYVNLDWAIIENPDGAPRLCALECNFRHNGFSFIVEGAQGIFGLKKERASIIYYYAFDINEKYDSVKKIEPLLTALNEGFAQTNNKGGVVLAGVPHEGHVPLFLAAETENLSSNLNILAAQVLNRV